MKKLEAEDIEKMSDSNADIKGRLSETVRDNAKHLLDPDRKVNGQAVPAQQPLLFTGGVMRSYQIEGVEWLRVSVDCWLCTFCLFDHRYSVSYHPWCACILFSPDVVGEWYQWDPGR